MKLWVKRVLSLVLPLTMVLSLMPPVEVRAEETASVKEIWTAEEFMAIIEDPKGSYRLMADLDLGSIVPLGTDGNQYFEGFLDGNGHSVSYQLQYVDGVKKYGLFCSLYGAEITELHILPQIDITLSDANASYYIGTLAAEGGETISAVECTGTISVKGNAGDCIVGGMIASAGNSANIHSCIIENNVDIHLSETTRVNYSGISTYGSAYNCDLRGDLYIEGNIAEVSLLKSAADSTCTQNVQIYSGTNSYGSIVADSAGSFNEINCNIEVWPHPNLTDYSGGPNVIGLGGSKGSRFTGSISTYKMHTYVYGANYAEGCILECDITCDNPGQYASLWGLNECHDCMFTGNLLISNTLYGCIDAIFSGARNLFYGDIACLSSDTGSIVGAISGGAEDCIFEGNVTSIGKTDDAGAHGISGNRCSFTGNIYAESTNAYVTGVSGTDSIFIGDLTARGSGSGASIMGVGENCYYAGNVTAGSVSGIDTNCSANANVNAYEGYAHLFIGKNSFFKGNVTVSGENAVELRADGSNCVAVVNATLNQSGASLWDNENDYCSFSASAENFSFSGNVVVNATGYVIITSDVPVAVNQKDVGSWNTGNIYSYVGIHKEMDCQDGCDYIIVPGEGGDYSYHHVEAIRVYRWGTTVDSNTASADWNGSINPETGDYNPQRDPANYTIQLRDTSNQIVPNAKLIVGDGEYITNEEGCIYIENGPTVISNLEVYLKDGNGRYQFACSREKFYAVPDKVNRLRNRYGRQQRNGQRSAAGKHGDSPAGGAGEFGRLYQCGTDHRTAGRLQL